MVTMQGWVCPITGATNATGRSTAHEPPERARRS